MYRKTEGGLLLPDTMMRIGGKFRCRLVRKNEVIDEWEDHNLIVNQGLDHILSVAFAAAQQITQWYVAPFGNNYAPQASDTAASIVSNAGEITAYSGNTRAAYSGVEATQQVTNQAAPASFTFTQAVNVYGAFIISSGQQNSTAGTLFAAASFTAPKAASVGDQLLMTYVLGAASS